jgi:ATP-dependent RNA helicase SrmB
MNLPTTFDDLNLADLLLRGVAKAGWSRPTPVQARVIPAALDGNDLLVQAATGTGKTAAFLLPAMQRLLDRPDPRSGTRVLVLVPTRELARQVCDHFLTIGSFTRLGVGLIIGGEARGHQVATLRRNPEVLVATPGRLLEHLGRGEASLDDLEVLVLDEADRMLDLGFAADVLAVIDQCRPGRQTLLFSATLGHRGLAPILGRLAEAVETVIMDPVRAQHPDIAHATITSDDPAHKERQLLWLLEHEVCDKTLVFCNTRQRAFDVAARLRAAGARCAALHGELDQSERKRVLGLFRRGELTALVATDVAARGLDVPGVERVINLDVPRSGQDYLHRAGRTGRAGEQGQTLSLVLAPEWNRLEGIARWLGLTLARRDIAGLEARFRGEPGRTKRGPGAKPKRTGARGSATKAPRDKNRLRDRKNIGKRRRPSGTASGIPAGDEPPRRRTRPDGDDSPMG